MLGQETNKTSHRLDYCDIVIGSCSSGNMSIFNKSINLDVEGMNYNYVFGKTCLEALMSAVQSCDIKLIEVISECCIKYYDSYFGVFSILTETCEIENIKLFEVVCAHIKSNKHNITRKCAGSFYIEAQLCGYNKFRFILRITGLIKR